MTVVYAAPNEVPVRAEVAEAAGDDVRPVPPEWGRLWHLVEGARARGWSIEQIEYLTSVIGITWEKAFRAGEAEGRVR